MTQQTYFENNGTHQNLVAKVDAVIKSIPQEEKGKAVIQYEQARTAYYDLFNNGLVNHAKTFRKAFGIAGTKIKSDAQYDDLEKRFDAIVLKAALELDIEDTATTTQKIIDDAIEYSHTPEFSAVTNSLCLAISVMSVESFNEAIGFFTDKIEKHFDAGQQKEFDLSITRELYAWLDAYKTENSKRELREYRDDFFVGNDEDGIVTQLINTLI